MAQSRRPKSFSSGSLDRETAHRWSWYHRFPRRIAKIILVGQQEMAKLHEQLALGAYLTPKKASSCLVPCQIRRRGAKKRLWRCGGRNPHPHFPWAAVLGQVPPHAQLIFTTLKPQHDSYSAQLVFSTARIQHSGCQDLVRWGRGPQMQNGKDIARHPTTFTLET